MADLVTTVMTRVNSLRAKRDPWLSMWQDLSDMFLPDKGDFTIVRAEAERNVETIYDGTPRLAARDLASAIDGLLKPKTSAWFNITVDDDELAEMQMVKVWLEHVRERMWKALYNPKAGFVQRSAEVDSYLVTFGWGPLFALENATRNGLLFKSYHLNSCFIDENSDGKVDTIAVEEKLTARQAEQRFGFLKLHPEIQEALLRGNKQDLNKTWTFMQLISPSENYRGESRIGGELPFKNCVVDEKHELIMLEGGFHEFPAAVPRWETAPGKVYSRSPAMLALPDSLTLQAMGKTLLIGGERAADPPIMVPSDGFLSPVRTFPGGVSVFDMQALTDSGLKEPFFTLQTSAQLPIGQEMQADYRLQVERAFFKNVLNLPIEVSGKMTATEILERKEEFIRVLGPIFGRLETDYVGATIDRVFGIMERAGAFMQRPEQLEGSKISFTFQSPIQAARKAVEVAGLSRTIEIVTPLTEFQPEIMDNIDGDAILRDAPDFAAIPSKWLRTEDEVKGIREGRAKQEQAVTVAGAAQPVSTAVKNLAQAQQIATEAQAA